MGANPAHAQARLYQLPCESPSKKMTLDAYTGFERHRSRGERLRRAETCPQQPTFFFSRAETGTLAPKQREDCARKWRRRTVTQWPTAANCSRDVDQEVSRGRTGRTHTRALRSDRLFQAQGSAFDVTARADHANAATKSRLGERAVFMCGSSPEHALNNACMRRHGCYIRMAENKMHIPRTGGNGCYAKHFAGSWLSRIDRLGLLRGVTDEPSSPRYLVPGSETSTEVHTFKTWQFIGGS